MKPLYVIIAADGSFARTGGSSTPVRVKIYEELSKAEKQCRIENKGTDFHKQRYPYLYPYKVVIYRPSIVETR